MGTETSVNTPGPTAEERELTAKQVQLAEAQLEAIRRQSQFQEQAFEQFQPLVEQQQNILERQQARAEELEPIQDELLERQLEAIRRGGAASPEQRELIEQATGSALEAGESDIERFQSRATERLREELAPALGLRPSDSPILDRGARVAEEAVRQQGQLASNLREAQASAELNFPLAADQVVGAQAQFQQQLAQSTQEFNQQLREAAMLNRLRLVESQGNLGLGLATGIPGASSLASAGDRLASNRLSNRTITESGLGLAGVGAGLRGVGGVLSGLGAAGVSLSSREWKENGEPVDEEKILSALENLPVEAWNYIGDDRRHIGPYAEDFRKAFGVGDGRTIDLLDVAGVLMASVKALAQRAAVLEENSRLQPPSVPSTRDETMIPSLSAMNSASQSNTSVW